MIAWFLLGSAFAYNLLMGIYRLHLHPLSRYPGPRLAAVTRLYEIYFAAWGDGSFDHRIRKLHQEFGPVVRITPDEVHVQEQPIRLSDCRVKGAAAGEKRKKAMTTRPKDKRPAASAATIPRSQMTSFPSLLSARPFARDPSAQTPRAPGGQLQVSDHAEAWPTEPRPDHRTELRSNIIKDRLPNPDEIAETTESLRCRSLSFQNARPPEGQVGIWKRRRVWQGQALYSTGRRTLPF